MKLPVLAQPISTQLPEPSVCEACGETFNCGATLAGCWCSDVKLSEMTRADLRSRYNRCLCRACLESLADGSRPDGHA